MHINIHSRGFVLSEALKNYVKSKIRLALDRYKDRIANINVTLVDINGPKGGEDMRCRISVKSHKFPDIVVQETTTDMYDAINICAHRAKRSASRQLSKFKRQWRSERLKYVDL